MRVPDLALRMIDAVANAVDLPVTVKMRLGWDDDSLNAADLARGAQNAGVRMVVVHGRTRCQFYKGSADWAAIAAVVDALDIPVLANGDIIDLASARDALALSGAAGIMVGRGIQGQPWLLAQLIAGLGDNPAGHDFDTPADVPALVAAHYEAMLDFYGADLGLRVARKQLGWYMDRAGTAPDLRGRILRARTAGEVLDLLPDALTPNTKDQDGDLAA